VLLLAVLAAREDRLAKTAQGILQLRERLWTKIKMEMVIEAIDSKSHF